MGWRCAMLPVEEVPVKMINAVRGVFTACWFVSLLFLDLLCLIIPRHRNDSSCEKILVVRLDAVGDFVLWTASLQQLITPYLSKNYHVSLLGNASWTSVADQFASFSEVIPLDRDRFLSNIPYRLRTILRIRQACYTTVIVPAYSRELLFGDAIIRLSGARNRIGSMGDCTNIRPWLKKIADTWYTRLLPADPTICYELQRNAEFVSRFWGTDVPLTMPSLPIQSSIPEELRGIEYFVIAPGALVAGKRWPLHNFRDVIDMIQQKCGITGVVCGATGEEGMGVALSNTSHGRILDYVGRTTLTELIALIAGAKLVLSNDSAAVHIAAAVSTPSVCVLGGQHFGRFLPYQRIAVDERPLPAALFHVMPCFQCNWICSNKISEEAPFPCVTLVTSDEMWQEAKYILLQEPLSKKQPEV